MEMVVMMVVVVRVMISNISGWDLSSDWWMVMVVIVVVKMLT